MAGMETRPPTTPKGRGDDFQKTLGKLKKEILGLQATLGEETARRPATSRSAQSGEAFGTHRAVHDNLREIEGRLRSVHFPSSIKKGGRALTARESGRQRSWGGSEGGRSAASLPVGASRGLFVASGSDGGGALSRDPLHTSTGREGGASDASARRTVSGHGGDRASEASMRSITSTMYQRGDIKKEFLLSRPSTAYMQDLRAVIGREVEQLRGVVDPHERMALRKDIAQLTKKFGDCSHKQRVAERKTLKVVRQNMQTKFRVSLRDVEREKGGIHYDFTLNLWHKFLAKCEERQREQPGRISFADFNKILMDSGVRMPGGKLRLLFETCERDKSGLIDWREFILCVYSVFTKV